MLNNIIGDLVDDDSIIAAALINSDGFTIERTSIDLRPNDLMSLFDLTEDAEIVSIVTTDFTVTRRKFATGHVVIIQSPKKCKHWESEITIRTILCLNRKLSLNLR